MNKVMRGGDVAVLVSPGFGAGWSTWNSEHAEFLLFDSGLVKLAEAHAGADQVENYLRAALEEESLSCGGWDQISVEWILKGTRFRVDEYDGSETLIGLSPDDGFVA